MCFCSHSYVASVYSVVSLAREGQMLKRNSVGRAVIVLMDGSAAGPSNCEPFRCLSVPCLPGQTTERCTFADQLDAE
jgi:hypothetical protein